MFFLKIFISFLLILLFTPTSVFARITPDEIYQAKRVEFEENVSKISDSSKKQTVQEIDKLLKDINLRVCERFDTDVKKLAAILDEEKSRQNITETVVAYGRGNTPLDTAAYYVNYAAEAVAYQKIQDYTPQIGSGNLAAAAKLSQSNLRSNLITAKGKVLRAKTEVQKALDYYEK